jgi:hypothetical protein
MPARQLEMSCIRDQIKANGAVFAFKITVSKDVLFCTSTSTAALLFVPD